MSMRLTAVTLAAITALTLAVAALLAVSPVAQAEERVCTGSIGRATVDNLRVPSGETCTLSGTRVQGTILVERAATLDATNVRVIGNVQSEGFERIRLATSNVGGSVQLDNGLAGGAANIARSTVNGDVQFSANEAQMIARGNTIRANFQVVGNTGGVQLTNNSIAQTLGCKENSPPPTGGNNTAGDKENQCARL